MEPGDVQENKTPVIPGEELVPQADDFALPEEELAPQEAVSIQPEEVLTPQNKLFVPNREVSSAQPEDVLTPQNTSPILSPASFGMKDPSKEQEEAGREEENLPFYKQVNFWKNIIVYVFAALLVGALIYGVVYFFNRYNEAEAKEKRKNTNKAADTVTEETEYIGGLPNAISDLQRALSGGSGSGSGSG
ncbi:MAG: hypothetical protein J5379_01290, partial [Clostridiales bacterium]|nr:hypothetical protein [Clostridiales bacterium]